MHQGKAFLYLICLDFLYDSKMELNQMIAEWVKAARRDAGLSGEALGARLALELGTTRGHTKANISHWETQKHRPSLEQLLAISRVTGTPLPLALVTAIGRADAITDPTKLVQGAIPVSVESDENPAFVQIQKVKLRLSAGITGFKTEPDPTDGSRTISVPKQWVDKNNFVASRLVAIRVKGQSMEPTLYPDDLVIVNTADTKVVDGSVYAVNYEGEPVIKRLTRDAGRWWLASDNPDQRKYHRKSCEGDECIIVGRVVKRESERL